MAYRLHYGLGSFLGSSINLFLPRTWDNTVGHNQCMVGMGNEKVMSDVISKQVHDYFRTTALFCLEELTDEERLEVFSYFCKECGRKQPITKDSSCQCWNDE